MNLGSAFSGGSGVLAFFTFDIKGVGVSPFVLAAGTSQPAEGGGALQGDWTRLVLGGTFIDVSTSDGYFQNVQDIPNRIGPIAGFTFSPMDPQKGQNVVFDASSSFDPDNSTGKGIRDYIWDFGDGFSVSVGSVPFVSHLYRVLDLPVSGNFSARLTVIDTDNHFEGMITHLVSILLPPPLCPLGLSIARVPQDCPTIQSAITSVVSKGTIQVSPGTYPENLMIQKPLSLTGSGNGLTVLDGGISITKAPGILLSGFTIVNNFTSSGISLDSSPGAILSNNEVFGHPIAHIAFPLQGVQITNSASVTLVQNIVSNETDGISIDASPNSMLRSNTMTHNSFNFGVTGSYNQNIDTSNTVDGKPILYEIGVASVQIPTNPGYLALVNSHDIQIGPINVTNVGQGILVVNSTRITINGLSATVVGTGASILNSSAIALDNSVFEVCGSGVAMVLTVASEISDNTFGCETGWFLGDGSGNIFKDNTVTVSDPFSLEAVSLFHSTLNQLINNHISMPVIPEVGRASPALVILESPLNRLLGNQIKGGVFIENSPQNVFKQNDISGGFDNIGIESDHIQCIFTATIPCHQVADYVQQIDPSNKVDGKPIYYLVNQNNAVVPSGVGFVGVINSTNVTIKNVHLSFNENDVLIAASQNVLIDESSFNNALRSGVLAWSTTGLTIENSTFDGNTEGIRLDSSRDGFILGNLIHATPSASLLRLPFDGINVFNSTGYTIQGNYVSDYTSVGITFSATFDNPVHPSNDRIVRNTVVGIPFFAFQERSFGIFAPSNAQVVGNTMATNFVGLEARANDTIYHNNFINNFIQAAGSNDRWDNGAGQGNYWTDYTGQDIDGDGVGDTLLPHLGLDNHPLMSPWMPNGLGATLTGRVAWPDFKRFFISKSNGIGEGLNAEAVNTGTVPEWVDAVFTITSSTGTILQVVSQPVWLDPGAKAVLTANISSAPGTYKVTVVLRYSSDAYLEWINSTTTTFSFTATP